MEVLSGEGRLEQQHSLHEEDQGGQRHLDFVYYTCKNICLFII